jgi:hypothetical protein
MNIWLDLEETIINNWDDGLLMNVSRIKHWLDVLEVKEINIWSFAIWNQDDKDFFVTSGMKGGIQRVLERDIIEFPSVEDMRAYVYEYERIKYDSQSEFMSINGKRWSFIKYCMAHQIGQHSILLDDAVPNLDVYDRKTKTNIQLYNVVDI